MMSFNIKSTLARMSIEEKIAQCMMISFSGVDINTEQNQLFKQFLNIGIGGVIFFSDNCTPISTPEEIQKLIQNIHHQSPKHLPQSFIAIDQEGGPVERLPHTYFPAGVSPLAISKSNTPEKLAELQYSTIANALSHLGFTMNFFPTLDVNLDPDNPIIGIRSFGDDPAQVWALGKIAIDEHVKNGIIPVGKHFPGHGNGKIDSHLSLPTLQFTPEEFSVFQHAIHHHTPALMVSHGYYPNLQSNHDGTHCPASLSKAIIQDLLISQEHYQGLIISDDMTMGAALQEHTPEEAAIKGFNAGLDILIYNQATETEWQVFLALVEAVKNNIITEDKLNTSVQKILTLKKTFSLTPSSHKNNTMDFNATITTIANQAISVTQGETLLPLNTVQSTLIIHPDRSQIHHYQFDAQTSPDITTLIPIDQSGTLNSYCYNPLVTTVEPAQFKVKIAERNDILLFIDYHSYRFTHQEALFYHAVKENPNALKIVISLGMPNPKLISQADCHLYLGSYRPATIHALVHRLYANNHV